MGDKYLEQIKMQYDHSRGGYPSGSELMQYLSERKDLSKEYYKFLEELGIGRHDIITEIDKGPLDSVILFNSIKDKVLVEISNNAYDIKSNNIEKIQSSLILSNKGIVLTNDRYKDYDLSYILDTVIKEGNLDINNSNLYARMFYDNIDLYLGAFGNRLDIDKTTKIEKLKYMRDKVKLLYSMDLDLCERTTSDGYQVVLHNPLVKSLKSVDKMGII